MALLAFEWYGRVFKARADPPGKRLYNGPIRFFFAYV